MKYVYRIADKLWKKPDNQKQIAASIDWGYTASYDHPELAHLKILKDRLLACGGWAVVLPFQEENLEKLLDRGYLQQGIRITYKRGQPNQCRANVSTISAANADTASIVTGYGLSGDGIWRQHSWLVFSHTGHLIETTEKRIGYFGFVMTLEEAMEFRYAHT